MRVLTELKCEVTRSEVSSFYLRGGATECGHLQVLITLINGFTYLCLIRTL